MPTHRNVGFAVKDWSKNGATSPWTIPNPMTSPQYWDAGVDGSAFVTPAAGEAADAVGIRGQGTSPNPPSNFKNHWLAKMNGNYYDAAYGLGPYTDRKAYEDAAFAGRLYVDLVAGGARLASLPVNDGDATNHNDEIMTYSA